MFTISNKRKQEDRIDDLVIVESPTKAKTLERFLGDGYNVMASKGHVRDLPSGKIGVEVQDGFKPQYTILSEKKSILVICFHAYLFIMDFILCISF